MAIFDATALLLLVAPHVAVPLDSKGKPITYAKERIDDDAAQIPMDLSAQPTSAAMAEAPKDDHDHPET